jgi:predicted DNA-binding transcriptional regulator AlpA
MKHDSSDSAALREFLTGPDVQARYRRSHVTIWRWMHDAHLGFPAPIRINGLNYWRLSDLEGWEAERSRLRTRR